MTVTWTHSRPLIGQSESGAQTTPRSCSVTSCASRRSPQKRFWEEVHLRRKAKEPAPMTEDLLEEQSEVLAKLGTSAEGAHLRARMQSACLLSDMKSSKAANPGCTLEDFVRWYSPRDYVEEEVVDESGDTVVRGDLSARMKIPGNMWMEAWATARTTPARRQKRLFDDTKEAEKVLHYLAVQKPADLTRHLLPCILHVAILKEREEESEEDILSAR
uniref:Rab3 GTPase-activating protein catalytic subunit n=1 Tax=Hucho hucho TaxID=62062 RepID=A0A4W5LBV1_9TELE